MERELVRIEKESECCWARPSADKGKRRKDQLEEPKRKRRFGRKKGKGKKTTTTTAAATAVAAARNQMLSTAKLDWAQVKRCLTGPQDSVDA